MSADGKMTIWMRLRNAREVIAGLRETAAQTGILGSSVDRLARHMDRASRRTFLMNQALFTMRRYSYMLTLATTAGAAAVVAWGFQYNSQVQEARIAFHKFGLDAAGVNAEIKELYRIAAISPFLFTNITASARKFLAFGISVGTTNELIRNLTDSLTAMGFATGAALNRATNAIVHMYALGRLNGQLVTQLTRDNIPIVQALQKELGLTADQLHNIAALGIPSAVAIQALNKYIRETPRFHNAALIFATKTWRGIITTTRDYMAQFMGRVEEPLFKKLQKGARRFLFWLQGAGQRGFDKGGIAGILGSFSPGLARLWGQLAQDLNDVWLIFVNGVIPAFMTVAHIVGPPLFATLWLITRAMNFLGHHTFLAKLFFGLLAFELGLLAIRFMVLLPLQTALMTRMIVMNTLQRIAIALGLARVVTIDTETGAIVANTVATERNVLVTTRLGGFLKSILTTTRLYTAALRLYTVATVGSIRGTNGQFVAMTRLERVALRMRFAFLRLRVAVLGYVAAVRAATVAMIEFLFTNPVGWIILAVAALAILYWRWKAFRNAVNEVILFFWRHPLAASFLPIIGPLINAVHLLKTMYDIGKKIWGWFGGGGGGGGLVAPNTGFKNPRLSPRVPRMATGGMALSSGWAMVGENGPELRYMPRGASVVPLRRGGNLNPIDMENFIIELHNHQVLEVDGEKMAESVSKHRLDAGARR